MHCLPLHAKHFLFKYSSSFPGVCHELRHSNVQLFADEVIQSSGQCDCSSITLLLPYGACCLDSIYHMPPTMRNEPLHHMHMFSSIEVLKVNLKQHGTVECMCIVH